MAKKALHWYDRLWIWPLVYFPLGFFNILFAWLGMIDFMVPMILAIFFGNKAFCNRYCGRGQLFSKLGGDLGWSRNVLAPSILASKVFRYGFLVFFMGMFGSMLYQTYLVAVNAKDLVEAIKLLFFFRVPWDFAYTAGTVPDWVAQFSFGFYSIMLTSEIIGIVMMAIYRPRTWCTFCPMGTMTQAICKMKYKEE